MASIVSFNRELLSADFRRSRCLPTLSHHVFIFPRAGRTAPKRANITDSLFHNLRKTFATRLLSRGAATTDVQHLLGHASVKTTEKENAAFVKNERLSRRLICWISQWRRSWRLFKCSGTCPVPPNDFPVRPHKHQHRIPRHSRIVAHPVLGGLHRQYGLLAKGA